MSLAAQFVQETARSLLSIRPKLDAERVLQDALCIQQIPAPTFGEDRRAAWIQKRFARFPLQDVLVDDVYNVYGRWPGSDPLRPVLLVSAHTDTVFSEETDLAARRETGRAFGPGLGDNSLGVAGLLALLTVFEEHRLRPAADIWVVANSREEGLGDLGGIRAVWDRLGQRLGAAVVLEGMALGRIYYGGTAVRRLHIVSHAPGGHSWRNFGQPSAVHGLIELGARILAITPPSQPRTTYNIGMIEGGHSVNSLASFAEMYLDLRSEQPDQLAQLEQQVLEAADMLQRTNLDFMTTIVGDRPAGRIDLEHPLVQMAAAALQAVNRKVTYEVGSTDANILLANKLPTVTIGLSYGGNAHRLDEFIETEPIADGVWQVVLLAMAAANQLGTWPVRMD
jgi:tripeptide aminopeptidase